MPPTSLWQMLRNLLLPRRHVTPEHEARAARQARVESQEKLADTDGYTAGVRDEMARRFWSVTRPDRLNGRSGRREQERRDDGEEQDQRRE